MRHQRRLLLDLRANSFLERRLSQDGGDSAIRNVARGADQFAICQCNQQRVQIRLRVQIENRWLTPELTKHNLRKLGAAKGSELRFWSFRCVLLGVGDGDRQRPSYRERGFKTHGRDNIWVDGHPLEGNL